MRDSDERTGKLFSYVDLEARVRADHPLRAIREIVLTALEPLHLRSCCGRCFVRRSTQSARNGS